MADNMDFTQSVHPLALQPSLPLSLPNRNAAAAAAAVCFIISNARDRQRSSLLVTRWGVTHSQHQIGSAVTG